MYVIREALGTSPKCRIASLQEGMSVDPSVYLRIKFKKKVARTHLLDDQTCCKYQRHFPREREKRKNE